MNSAQDKAEPVNSNFPYSRSQQFTVSVYGCNVESRENVIVDYDTTCLPGSGSAKCPFDRLARVFFCVCVCVFVFCCYCLEKIMYKVFFSGWETTTS